MTDTLYTPAQRKYWTFAGSTEDEARQRMYAWCIRHGYNMPGANDCRVVPKTWVVEIELPEEYGRVTGKGEG